MQENGTTPLSSLSAEIEQVVQLGTYYLEKQGFNNRKIVQILGTLFNPNHFDILCYLFKHGAATAWTLRYRLNIPKRTVYHVIEDLRSYELVKPQIQVKPAGKMKRPASIWGTHDCSQEQVRQAYQLHLNLISKKYRFGENLGQTILLDYGPRALKEIMFMDILAEAKKMKIPYSTRDIADHAAGYLMLKGVKVIY